MDDFDREFSFEELVPNNIIESIIPFLKRMGIQGIAVFLSDFSLYFSDNFSDPFLIDKIRKTLTDMSKTQCGKIKTASSEALYFPIFHEGEPVAYFVMKFRTDSIADTNPLVNTGFLIIKMFNHFMVMNQKVIMTSDLHHMVVEDSFDQLKGKTQKLIKSERKYRLLAQSLETEVEKKTREIKDKQAQLLHQDKMASIGQLAAGVAHEINNPIGFINSNLDAFKEYIEDLNKLIVKYRKLPPLIFSDTAVKSDSMIRELVDTIQKVENNIEIDFMMKDIDELLVDSLEGIDRIKKIVITLKDFAHPGKDRPESADINQNIESTLNIVHNEIKYKADVVKDYGQLPDLYCYPRQLNQVFMNILVNAAQAIESFGRIKIKTRHKPPHIVIQISDTGAGIPEKNLSKIFDPFFTTKDVGEGTGLGLNLVYGIIKQHDGEITVESSMDKGTEFTISLPLNSNI